MDDPQAIPIVETIRQYLRGDLTLEGLRDWLALYQWDLPAKERVLADEVDVVLVHLDDGFLGEQEARARLSSLSAWGA